MRTITFRPHPISLTKVHFPRTQFALTQEAPQPPYRFPGLHVAASTHATDDGETGFLVLRVSSQEQTRQGASEGAGGDRPEDDAPVGAVDDQAATESADKEPDPSLTFDFIARAEFRVRTEGFTDFEDALKSFLASDTPALILWPYVRAYMADMVRSLGLPPLNLPLAQIHTIPEASQDESEQD